MAYGKEDTLLINFSMFKQHVANSQQKGKNLPTIHPIMFWSDNIQNSKTTS